jgi:hypothetical protein
MCLIMPACGMGTEYVCINLIAARLDDEHLI